MTFTVGQKVRCIRAASTVQGCKGRLTRGEIYTVSDVQKTDWLVGINLVEAPISSGPALYGASRFEPA